MNFPNRVPVLAKPQDGSSMRKVSSALKIFSVLLASIGTSLRHPKVTILTAQGHEFLFQNLRFRIAERPAYHCVAPKRSRDRMLEPSNRPSYNTRAAVHGPQFCY